MGVVLPAELLKRLNLTVKDRVYVTLKDKSIVINPVPRQNWEAAAIQMHTVGDDCLHAPDVFDDENMEDLEEK